MRLLFLLALFLIFPFTAQAEELYSPDPHCAVIKNETKEMEFVAIRTAFYTMPNGMKNYYEEVLHLDPGKERQICVKGPFLPNYKVFLTVKSFFPLFDCTTKLEGEIAIRERPRKEDESRDVYATCIE